MIKNQFYSNVETELKEVFDRGPCEVLPNLSSGECKAEQESKEEK